MDLVCNLPQSKILNVGIRFRVKNSNFNGASKTCYISRTFKKSKLCLFSKHQKSVCGKLWKFGVKCQPNDSLAFIDGNSNQNVEKISDSSSGESDVLSNDSVVEDEKDAYKLEDLRELFQKAVKDLEVARLNSTKFEEKAQRISESAISLKDAAENARGDITATVSSIQDIINEEHAVKELVQKATMALSMAEARLQLAVEAIESRKDGIYNEGDDELELVSAEEEIKECKANLEHYETELRRVQAKKEELQDKVERLSEAAEKAQLDAVKAEEDVANIMLLAEQAVAYELEATQRVNDAELALQKAEKAALSIDATDKQLPSLQEQIDYHDINVEEDIVFKDADDVIVGVNGEVLVGDSISSIRSDEGVVTFDDTHDEENGRLSSDKEDEVEDETSKNAYQQKQDVLQKEKTKDPAVTSPKALQKKSSRFVSASFFSFQDDGEEFTATSAFQKLITSARKQAPKLIFGAVLIGMGAFFLNNRAETSIQSLNQPEIVTLEEVTANTKPLVREIRRFPKRLRKLLAQLPHQEINEEEASLFDMLWLLLASVIFVPTFQKLPGGSPVLGYLAAGILIGPYGLSIIRHVHGTKAVAEFGVVFLLFNIGLELSVERLSSMKKYVFGLGSAQVLVTAVVAGLVAHLVAGLPGPASIVIVIEEERICCYESRNGILQWIPELRHYAFGVPIILVGPNLVYHKKLSWIKLSN